VFAYVGLFQNLKDLKAETLIIDISDTYLHWRAGSVRSFAAIRKEAELFCGSFARKDEMFAYVGRNPNKKDPEDQLP